MSFAGWGPSILYTCVSPICVVPSGSWHFWRLLASYFREVPSVGVCLVFSWLARGVVLVRPWQKTNCPLMPPGVAVCGYISFLMMMTVVAQLKVICYLLHHKVLFLSSKLGQSGDSEILQMFFLRWMPLSHLYLSLACWRLSASIVPLTFTAVRKRASPQFIDCFCKCRLVSALFACWQSSVVTVELPRLSWISTLGACAFLARPVTTSGTLGLPGSSSVFSSGLSSFCGRKAFTH